LRVCRQVSQRTTESLTSCGILDGPIHRVAHARCSTGGIVRPRYGQHGRYRAHAASCLTHELRMGAPERKLRGGQRTRPELVLQAIDLDALQPAVSVPELHEKERKTLIAL